MQHILLTCSKGLHRQRAARTSTWEDALTVKVTLADVLESAARPRAVLVTCIVAVPLVMLLVGAAL